MNNIKKTLTITKTWANSRLRGFFETRTFSRKCNNKIMNKENEKRRTTKNISSISFLSDDKMKPNISAIC